MSKRRKKRMRRWIGILMVLVIIAGAGVYIFGGDKGIGRTIKEKISLVSDRMDELVKVIKDRKSTVPKVKAPQPPVIKIPEPEGPPLSKPISDRDRVRLEKILDESR